MELSNRLKDASTAEAVDNVGNSTEYSRDDRDLIRRNFGFMSVLGFSCTVLITWEGMFMYAPEEKLLLDTETDEPPSHSVSTQSLLNGGPAGVIWGYIIVWVGTLSTFVVLSELASMAPTSGGQYQ
ncbi:hypothetical protein ONZ43_g1422 [Nemania bipapillata]|uniref:Uncharacterized protein n=1 Tax=Nemania bipapillata TaxID=110536 RepID=A0ACC2J4U3_9PEZI|nr:hypothetical protein ONZ43_g1422 [Nemania bipapillata]